MLIASLLALCGLAILAVAADQLVLGSARLAVGLRVPPVVVGVVVIGLGTSAPEFLVSGVAAAGGEVSLAVGNMTGSNVINLTLVLGLAALLRPIVITAPVLDREVPLTIGAMAAFAVAVVVGLDRLVGALLAVAMLATFLLLIRFSRSGGRALATEVIEAAETTRHRIGVEAVRALIGLLAVLGGADLLVSNAVRIATELGVSPGLIGFTLVAGGTSLPELVTAVQATRRKEPDLMVGNLLGSNIFNSLGGGAVIGLAAPAGAAQAGAPINAWVLVMMLAVGLIAGLAISRDNRVTRPEAALLVVLYLAAVPLLL